MLSIRSLLKKENGTCPICALPYVREKRILRASYFDNAYDITAWTLRCAECGYEVIQPGTARISIHADVQRDTYMKEAEGPPLNIKITTPLPEPKTGIEGSGATEDVHLETAKSQGAKDTPDAQDAPNLSGACGKLEGQMEDPTGTEAAETEDPGHDGGSHQAAVQPGRTDQTESPEPEVASMPPKLAGEKEKSIPAAQDTGSHPDGKPAEKRGRAESPEKARSDGAGNVKAPEATLTGNSVGDDSGAGYQPGPGDKAAQAEQAGGDSAAVSGTGLEKGSGAGGDTNHPDAGTSGKRAMEGAERSAIGSQVKGCQEEKAAVQGRGRNAGMDQNTGQAKEKSAGQEINSRDKKTPAKKGSDKKRTEQGAASGQGRTGGQEKPAAADGRQPHSPAGASSQPVPRGRQPGGFPGGIQSGFPGGGMFPSSALSNLEALRTSIHADTGKQGKELLDAVKKKKAGRIGNLGSGKSQTPGADKQLSAGKGGKEGQQKISGEKGEKAGRVDVAEKGHLDTGVFADKQNPTGTPARDTRQISMQKTVSAEDHGKSNKKTLSAEHDGIPAGVSAQKATEKTGKDGGPGNTAHAMQSQDAGGDAKPAAPEKPADAGKPVKGGANPRTSSRPDGGDGPEKKKPDTGTGKEPEQEAKSNAVGADQGNGDSAPEKTPGDAKEGEAPEAAEGREDQKRDQREMDLKDLKGQAMETTRKISDRLPADLVEKLPVISQISKQQKHALFVSEEKRFLEQHIPHKQVIINDLAYNTDNSEMFLRTEGRCGLDNPCVHYNYRTKNGNFFRCTVKYKQEDSIRPLDLIEAKRMLEEHPDLYKKFFPDSVSDA